MKKSHEFTEEEKKRFEDESNEAAEKILVYAMREFKGDIAVIGNAFSILHDFSAKATAAMAMFLSMDASDLVSLAAAKINEEGE